MRLERGVALKLGTQKGSDSSLVNIREPYAKQGIRGLFDRT
jgi:hypothetical protein